MSLDHIDNIIFDLGGVLINLDTSKTFQAFEALMNAAENRNTYVSPDHPVFHQFEKGQIPPAEFREKIRSLIAPNATDEAIDVAWNAMLLDFPASRLQLLKRLSQDYRLFLLSNTNVIHLNALEKILHAAHGYPNLDPFFEKTYYSHQIGMRKPDEEIFRHVLTEQHLNPNRTLFLDDTRMHLEGAAKTGIQTQLIRPDFTVHHFFDQPQ
jgi:putative hydrolase of the HAD superfamily